MGGIFRSGPFGTAVGRKESNSVANAVVSGVLLLLRHWVSAVPTAGVTGALCLAWLFPRYGRGRKLDSKLADVILEVRLLPPSCWVTALASSGVAVVLFSN